MDRPNFYLILELSIDPPESDAKVIEEAVKRKQTEWSRYRNHPTKALQAKQFIGLIPEIRRVMSDPELRRSEGQDALNRIREQEKEKFAEIDRHIGIRLSKGYITDEEVFKLAQLHSLPESKIRERINRQEEKKYREIDKNIGIRMRKGFITEEEITTLAELHFVSPKDIRRRVNCPIRKQNNRSSDKPRLLDPIIEKRIADNLKIVGQPSLYVFLGVSENSSLEQVQKQIQKKDAEIQKIGKKDAVVTAGGALIGLCISVFKSEEIRKSYDATLLASYMKKLNSDIDVAGLDGVIRTEYFELLVQTGMELGMGREESARYIKKYCRDRKWVIRSSEKRKTVKRLLLAAVGGILLTMVGAGIFFHVQKKERTEQDYTMLLTKVESVDPLQEKRTILEDYLYAHPASPYTADINNSIKAISVQIEKGVWCETQQKVQTAFEQGFLASAADLCRQFLDRYPESALTPRVNQELTRISNLIEDRAFEKLETAESTDISDRVQAYVRFMTEYPTSRHLSVVRDRIDEMNIEFYLFWKRKTAELEQQEQWTNGRLLCERFLKIYPDGAQAETVKNKLQFFNRKIREEQLLSRLIAEAASKGTDFLAARLVFTDFLNTCPYSPLTVRVQQELQRIESLENTMHTQNAGQQMRHQLQVFKDRFVENREGVITDKKTGLMWVLLDSFDHTRECMTYDEALQYVEQLTTGGYQNWRLPTAAELSTLLEGKNRFPASTATWYWTSQSYSRYAGGWSRQVDIFEMNEDSQWEKQQVDSLNCGVVRAVRQ